MNVLMTLLPDICNTKLTFPFTLFPQESSPTKATPSLPTVPGAPDLSSSSSKDSTPEMKRWQQSQHHGQQSQHHQQQKPVVSPRGAPPPIPVRSMSNESMPAAVNMRPKQPIGNNNFNK